jgi:hypothetical protein
MAVILLAVVRNAAGDATGAAAVQCGSGFVVGFAEDDDKPVSGGDVAGGED